MDSNQLVVNRNLRNQLKSRRVFPIVTGYKSDWFLRKNNTPYIKDMLIRDPIEDHNNWCVPEGFRYLAYDCAGRINQYTDYDEDCFYCYLSYEYKYVKAGEVARKSGWHLDGFQGKKKVPLQSFHFIYTDLSPTKFCREPLGNISDLNGYNLFEVIDREVNLLEKRDRNNVFNMGVGNVVMYDGNTPHSAGVNLISGWRTFVRVSFSTELYDRKGNTINPDLPVRLTEEDLEVNGRLK